MPHISAKSQLRKAAFEKRKSLSPDYRADASNAMTARFLATIPLPPKGAVVGGFLPINTEISPLQIMKALEDHGCRIAVPIVPVGGTHGYLEYRSWSASTPVYKNLHGIDEPDLNHSEYLVPDFIIVPLLAFDPHGHRLGYGSGHFDRTFDHLRDIRQKFVAYGVAFEDQKVEAVPVEDHDFPLHGVVTDKAFYNFVENPL